MFDPLDFLSGVKQTPVFQEPPESGLSSTLSESQGPRKQIHDATQFHELETPEDLEAPIQVMDLPYVQIAPATVILATLLLLKPSSDVNFKKSDEHTVKSVAAICREKNLPEVFLEQMVDWYSRMSLEGLDSAVKICAKIPALASTADGKELLAYYTTILSKYNKLQDNDDIVDWLLKEVSLRISEKCGRTAQPAMNRTFEVSGLAASIELHEPALTSDNLGLKTWGASLVLARKICQKLSTFEPSESLRILELGAGTGLVGIAFIQKILEVGSAQKFRVHLTDLPDIVPNLQKNVDLNKCNREPNVEVAVDVLDWTDPSSFQEKYGHKKFDVLLIADPIYSPQHPRWVVNMIKEFLHPHGVAHLGLPIRPKYLNERQELWRLLEEAGLQIKSEEIDEGVDDWGSVSYLYKEIISANKS